MSLVPVDTTNEVAITSYLQQARDWLTRAVDETGPEQIAAAKAEIATAAEATKQLGLSKEIQLDALEMVRRAEYALGKAIRKGQAEGVIATKSEMATYAGRVSAAQRLGLSQSLTPPTKPSDFASESELMGARGDGLYALARAEPEEFEQAVEEAKAEGNLSRANIVRKVKQTNPDRSRSAKADVIEDLAARGFTSKQMADRVGVSDARVRDIAREFEIDIAADRVVGKQRRLDHTQMVESTVTDIENAAEFIESFIDLAEVDFTGADEWVSSLSNSIAAFTRFRKQIKEKTHHV